MRDNLQREVAVRAAWEFKPTLSLFAEVQHVRRTHATVSALDQLDRDSDGERYRAGVSFGNTGQKLRGEASIGWGTQRFDDPRLASIDGILVDANLAWRPTALTSFLWTARSEFGDATAVGASGQRSITSGLEARHAFRRYLIGTAGIRWTGTDTFGSSPTVENELLLQLGAEYFLNREVTLFSRYQHTHFTTSTAGGNYDADEFRVGVRVRR